MKIYLYIFDTLADWEIAYVTAELNSKRFFKNKDAECTIIKVGRTLKEIVTMGGMKLRPDILIEDMEDAEADILILPGGNGWLEPVHEQILEAAKKRILQNKLTAAICGATLGLANTGIMNSLEHTSNDKGYLSQMCRNYHGQKFYQAQPAVSSHNLITASGQGALEFTCEILKALKVFPDGAADSWLMLNKTNDPRYFYELYSKIQVQE